MNLRATTLLLLLLLLLGCKETRFTETEQDYIADIADNQITWACEEIQYPILFVNNQGQPDGISADYIKLISKKSGLKFNMIATGDKSKMLTLLKSGEIDMVSSLRMTPERAESFIFTRPYIFVDLVMLQRTDKPQTTGIGVNFAVKRYLVESRTDLRLVEFENDEESFNALRHGEIESVVLDAFSANFYKKKYRVGFNQTPIQFEYFLSFAISKFSPKLRTILDKAITDITPEEHAEILRKWT